MVQYVLTGCILLLCIRTDIREKQISKKIVWCYLLLALLGSGLEGACRGISLTERLVGMAEVLLPSVLPGFLSLFLSWSTREALGYGDSFLILGAGLALGFRDCMELLLWAFFFSALWSVWLMIRHRADRKQTIPFVPFLVLGWLMLLPQIFG